MPAGESPSPILVTKCSVTKRVTADVLPSKGVVHPWCVQALVRVLLDAGHAKIILRSDDEPAIVAFKERAIAIAKEQHKIDVIPETTPHSDSQSNGLAEVAVRDVKGVARSLHYDMRRGHPEGASDSHVDGALRRERDHERPVRQGWHDGIPEVERQALQRGVATVRRVHPLSAGGKTRQQLGREVHRRYLLGHRRAQQRDLRWYGGRSRAWKES